MTSPGSNKARIYVVDDVLDNHVLLTRGLERAGFATVAFDNGVEAIARISSDPPDLLLLDWMMPNLSGMEVLHAVRQHYDVNELPVIMCTAKDEATSIGRAIEDGANDYIQKPVNMRIAIARVNAQLERRAALIALSSVNQDLEQTLAERTRALMDREPATAANIPMEPGPDIDELHRLASWLRTDQAQDPVLLEACADSISSVAHRLSSSVCG